MPTITDHTLGNLFIVSAASGTGKTSLVKALLEHTPALTVSISHTTRPPRTGETDGVHYHFVSTDQFDTMVQQGDFLEFAQVFDNFYGTAQKSVDGLLAQGRDVVLEIDWQGALQVKKLVPQAVMIFVLPPNLDALKDRLQSRGQDSLEVIAKRLAGAIYEMRQYVHFDYVVINDDFDTALKELQAIVISQRLTFSKQQLRHTQTITDLLNPSQ